MNNEVVNQFSIEHYFNNEERNKINIVIKKTKEDIIESNNEKIIDLNEIVEVKYGNEIYKTWKVESIRPFITKFLKDKFSNSLIVREINRIDITMFDYDNNNQIPVEIQKTPIIINCKKIYFSYSLFEDYIRRQLEDNIENYGLCWFFFDMEYLRFLQSKDIQKSTSMNLTWIVKLMKEETLKVFVIKYDGVVKELSTKDFDFLKDISQTCVVGYDNDERVLNRNKLKIFHNVVNGYKFTQEEITQFENDFDKRINKSDKISSSEKYFRINDNERCNLYGRILKANTELSNLNDILSCTCNGNLRPYLGVTLGIFKQNEFNGNNKQSQIQFIDKFNISQYFPGYIRNKQLWDYCKNKNRIFTYSEFSGIVEGYFNYEFIKKQSIMLDY